MHKARGACRASLKKLVAMVGRSTTIYRRICHVLAAGLRASPAAATGFPEAALCALRSQLLMALHDETALHPTQTPFSFEQVRLPAPSARASNAAAMLSDLKPRRALSMLLRLHALHMLLT